MQFPSLEIISVNISICEEVVRNSAFTISAKAPWNTVEEFVEYEYFNDVESFCSNLDYSEMKGKSIFLKGSRGIGLEKLINHLKTL